MIDHSRRAILKAVTVISAASALHVVGGEVFAHETISFVIPDFSWKVGTPVDVNLLDFVVDPGAHAVIDFTVNKGLPAGITLTNGMLNGTPTEPHTEAGFVVTLVTEGHTPNSPVLS